jgi:hypothetical protein
MFELVFLDEPVPGYSLGTDQQAGYAQITIQEFREKLIIPLDHWSREDYRRQWLDGASRVVMQGANTSALFTEMYDFSLSHYAPVCWQLYKEGDTVYVQNRWLPRKTLPRNFDPFNWYDNLPPQKISTPEGDQISVWKTTISALAAWRSKLLEAGNPTAM